MISSRRLLCVLGMFLTACGTQPTIAPPTNTTQQQQLLQALENWQVSGRIALRSGNRSDNLGWDWRQQGSRSSLRLRGLAGAGQLSADHRTREITLGEGLAELTGEQRQQLRRQLGQLPVFDLTWWLRGLPVPGQEMQLQWNAAGLPSRLQQFDWSIHYDSFQQVGGLTLPRAMRMVGPGVSGKLILKSWRVAE